ncbi:MAG: C-terminal binding protein [Chloroflexi bacterium]|nr:MAG: C-terminal binding protein [Chloroflexota bacterium]
MSQSVVITDSAAMLQAAIATLDAGGTTYECLPDGLTPEEVAARSADADVLIVTFVPLRKPAIRLLRRVGLIVRCGVGVDGIDVEAATEQGILVANVPDYAVQEVADHTMLLLLAAARRLNHFQRSWPEKGWASVEFPAIRRLQGRRLGIVGLGRIGSQVALRARAFGMAVVAYSPHLDAARLTELGVAGLPLDELFRTSDVISLHAPLTLETRHLLDERAFAQMRRGVIIVNTARGGLIDLNALQSAIDQGIVGAVALDVLEREPFPDLSLPFLRDLNASITPHVAWYSDDAVRELGVLAAEEALRFLRGQPLRAALNPEARVRYHRS